MSMWSLVTMSLLPTILFLVSTATVHGRMKLVGPYAYKEYHDNQTARQLQQLTKIVKFNHSILKDIADKIEASQLPPGTTIIEMGANNGAWTDKMMNEIKATGKTARYGTWILPA